MPEPSPSDGHNRVTELPHISDDHKPLSSSENVFNIKPGEGLANLVELQQNMIPALQTEMCERHGH